jgi:hypothetical protein
LEQSLPRKHTTASNKTHQQKKKTNKNTVLGLFFFGKKKQLKDVTDQGKTFVSHSVANDASVLLGGAGQEAGHVHEREDREVEGVAKAHKSRGLLREEFRMIRLFRTKPEQTLQINTSKTFSSFFLVCEPSLKR